MMTTTLAMEKNPFSLNIVMESENVSSETQWFGILFDTHMINVSTEKQLIYH
jgi:hypothetical protein